MRPRADWSLYLVTDRALCGSRSLPDVVDAAVRGGVTVVQLREKSLDSRAFYDTAVAIRERLAGTGVPLIINDRVDIALAAGAEGVHLGQSDLPVEVARRMLGPDVLVGLSVETLEQGRAADDLDVDYLGVSPIFSTPTKTDTGPAWGLDGLRALSRVSRRPLVAIGGLHEGNTAEVIRAGASGVAVVSALCAAEDPARTAAGILAQITAARR
jgi:thiamine-phosphate pyrophosphorylase